MPTHIIEPPHWRTYLPDFALFEQYYKLADQLIERSSKEDIAEIARLLAMNVAHYQSNYGKLPLEDTLTMINTNMPNEAQIKMVSDGLEILVDMLGIVASGVREERH